MGVSIAEAGRSVKRGAEWVLTGKRRVKVSVQPPSPS